MPHTAVKAVRLFVATVVGAATLFGAIPAVHAQTIPIWTWDPNIYYRNGDDKRTIPGLIKFGPGIPAESKDYPKCTILVYRGSASCNSCCSEPDKILSHLFEGPDPLLPPTKRKSLDEWYIDKFWPPLEAKIVESTNRITNQILTETASIGGFMDAQNQIRAKTSLQKGSAAAAVKFAPSEALCRYASLSQALATSEAGSEAIKRVMSTRSFERQLLRANVTSGANETGNADKEKNTTKGQSADKDARWLQYTKTFCHPGDNGDQGTDVCQGSNDTQYNSDINFAKTISNPSTLEIGPNDGDTKDKQNVNALADNLYAHDISNTVPTGRQLDPNVEGNFNNIRKYMLLRSILAKRAVAENTFSSVAAMKAKGSPGSAEYTKKLMMELGISEDEAKEFVGTNPSYYAQMEALTRKMYQSPAFYVNLMESSTNVQRQQSAMKALELMQQRDMYKSIARSEMLFATLLEVYVSRQQSGVDKRAVQSR